MGEATPKGGAFGCWGPAGRARGREQGWGTGPEMGGDGRPTQVQGSGLKVAGTAEMGGEEAPGHRPTQRAPGTQALAPSLARAEGMVGGTWLSPLSLQGGEGGHHVGEPLLPPPALQQEQGPVNSVGGSLWRGRAMAGAAGGRAEGPGPAWRHQPSTAELAPLLNPGPGLRKPSSGGSLASPP